MTDWLRCDLHGAYEGAGGCPCCLSTGGQPAPESTPGCLTRVMMNMASSAVTPTTTKLAVSGSDAVAIRARWEEAFGKAYKALDRVSKSAAAVDFDELSSLNTEATRIATLEAENAALRAKLSAAEEALAGVRTAQKAAAASIEPAGPTQLYRPVGPLERATGVGPSQPAQAVLAALAGRVVR